MCSVSSVVFVYVFAVPVRFIVFITVFGIENESALVIIFVDMVMIWILLEFA